jgi:hypothetical protein
MPCDPELNTRPVHEGYAVAIVALTKGLLPVLPFSLFSTIPHSLLGHVTFSAYYVKPHVFQRICKMEDSGALAYPCCSMQNDSDHVRDITPWSGLFTEKVTAAQLSNTFPAFYRRNRSITWTASHRSTSSARQIQSTPSVPSYLSFRVKYA